MCTACIGIFLTAFLSCTVHSSYATTMPMFTGGVSTRLVQCINSSSGTVSESSCVAPAPASNMSCNMDPCDFCQENVCSGEGTCIGEACQCNPGYSGSYCQVQCCLTACRLSLRCEASLHALSFQLSAIQRCATRQCHKHPCLHCCGPKDLVTPRARVCLCVCVCVSLSVCLCVCVRLCRASTAAISSIKQSPIGCTSSLLTHGDSCIHVSMSHSNVVPLHILR